MSAKHVLSVDQGTTGTTVILFDEQGQIVARAYQELKQYYPQPGWVEQDAWEIWQGVEQLIAHVLEETKIGAAGLVAMGITNQRETVVLWDRKTGRPVAPAIVWQCRRSASLCETLRRDGLEPIFQEKTGLVLDAYFSGTKLKWLLDENPDLRRRAELGQLAFGTIDSWLIYNLTGGRQHVTDYSNASRTLLFNIHELAWDPQLLEILAIPAEILPAARPSSEIYGRTQGSAKIPAGIPVAAAAGDQQAALFGQACFRPGMVKATFGTGAFVLMNTGLKPVSSQNGLLTTIAWGLEGKVEYALEGSVFVAGAAIQWLRDELGLISQAAQSEEMALAVPDTNGVHFVPAFVGLGAPHWQPYARGTITGISQGANAKHLVRATLEAIVYQTKEVLDVMVGDAQIPIRELRVDGGACANQFLCQFLADMSNVGVQRPGIVETTALGAAYLAGLAVGLWKSQGEIEGAWQMEHIFQANVSKSKRAQLQAGWQRAVAAAKSWATHG